MPLDFKVLEDKATKIALVALTLLPLVVYYYFNSQLTMYTSSISDELNVYMGFSIHTLILALCGTMTSLFFLSSYVGSSKQNTTKIESFVEKLLTEKFVIVRSDFLYHFILLLFTGFATYSLLEAIISMANGASLHMGVNLVTMEKNEYFNQDIKNMNIFVLGYGLFMAAIFTVKPKKTNNNFIFGLFVLPFLLSALSNWGSLESLYSIINDGNAYNVPAGVFNSSYILGKYGNIAQVSFLCLLAIACLAYTYLEIKKGENIYKNLGFMCLGYVSSIAVKLLAVFIVCNGPIVEQFKNDPNIIDVDIHGETYTINQSLLSIGDDNNTEWLIETYSGMSIHNVHGALEYIVGPNYKGDKEKAIKLSADILLTNLRKFEGKREKTASLIRTEKISMTTMVNIMIPLIIYENSPLHHQERALESILAGDYQDGVDYYLEDAVNRKTPESLTLIMKDPDHQERTNSFGHPLLRVIINSLIDNNLATLDYSKANPEHREKLKELMTENPYGYMDGKPSDETVENWYKMFKVDRFITD